MGCRSRGGRRRGRASRVFEGEPTFVDTLAIEGLDLLNGEELTAEMRDQIPLQQDEVFNEPDLLESRTLLENEFQNRGYVYATVLLEYRIDKDERTASVTYSVDAGDQYYVGETRIEGYDPDDLDLIQGQLEFASGEVYDRQDILDSQRNLYELGLFRRVLIEPQLASVRGDTVDVLVSVAPAPTHIVRVGSRVRDRGPDPAAGILAGPQPAGGCAAARSARPVLSARA